MRKRMSQFEWKLGGLEVGGYAMGALGSRTRRRGWEIAGWAELFSRFARASLERLRDEREPVCWKLTIRTERPGREQAR